MCGGTRVGVTPFVFVFERKEILLFCSVLKDNKVFFKSEINVIVKVNFNYRKVL